MRRKVFKIFTLISLAVLSSLLAYKGAYFIGEKYFFDQLFYRKSLVFGYTYQLWKAGGPNNNPRYRDLDLLTQQNSSPENQVLGISTPSAEYKIAVIGDSFSYGLGVRDEESFPRVMENELNKVRPTKVYSLAQPGDSLLDHYVKFVLAGKSIQPDLYIITALQNDLLIDFWESGQVAQKYPGELDAFNSLKGLCPPKQIFGISQYPQSLTWNEMIDREYMPPYSDQYGNVCLADQILKAIHDSGKKVIYFVFDGNTVRFDPAQVDEPVRKNIIMTKEIISLAHKNSVDVLFPSDVRFVPVSAKEGHPSAVTENMYAQTLIKELMQNKKWELR